MEQAAKHSAAMVESMNNVNSGIKDCLAMLANAISNMYPQQMIPPKQWGNTQITVIRTIKCHLFIHLNCHLTLPLNCGLGTYMHRQPSIGIY